MPYAIFQVGPNIFPKLINQLPTPVDFMSIPFISHILQQISQWTHHQVNILIFQFLDNMKICFLRSRHTGMPQSASYTGDGNTGKKQQRSMSMPQPMDWNGIIIIKVVLLDLVIIVK